MNAPKMLQCANEGRLTLHHFYAAEYRSFSYFSSKEITENAVIRSDGMKDIWVCQVCGADRIYGASLNKYMQPSKARSAGTEVPKEQTA
jgi:hypothetical protein